MDVLVPWGHVDGIFHLEPSHPNVRRRSQTGEINCRAPHRMIVWGHHPLVVKSLFVVGFLYFVLSIVGKWQIGGSFEIRLSCLLLPMLSFFHRASFVHPTSTQHPGRLDIRNHQYDRPCPVFANICIECSTTNRAATIIELAILVLSLVGIRRTSRHKVSHLARLLKTQGIAYFVMVASLHVATMVNGPSPPETDIR